MLRSLVDEVVRRRLWPILLAAVVIAVAAPLLFMKGTPAGAPAASSAPPPAQPGKLPSRAEKLVTTSDKAATPHHKTSGQGRDPFAPPASAIKASAAAAAGTATNTNTNSSPKAAAQPKTSTKPIPVVITDSNGSSVKVSNPTPSTTKHTANTTASLGANVDSVDVRFGAKSGTKIRRGLRELRTLKVDGKVAAVFVKWSPKRQKAVFAISPTTIVTGDVQCRRKQGVCRYVDIPAGKYARLTWLSADGGTYITRRLDVVHVHHG